jgi:DNA-binding transcriptional regulator YbjK
MDARGHKLVFFATPEKRITMLAPMYWHGAHKHALEKLMQEEMQKRQLTLEKTGRVSYLESKNTMVK